MCGEFKQIQVRKKKANSESRQTEHPLGWEDDDGWRGVPVLKTVSTTRLRLAALYAIRVTM